MYVCCRSIVRPRYDASGARGRDDLIGRLPFFAFLCTLGVFASAWEDGSERSQCERAFQWVWT